MPKVQIFSAHHHRRKKIINHFFSQMIHLDTYKAVPTQMPPSNELEFRKDFTQNQKKTKKKFGFLFLKKNFCEEIEFSFDKHANVFLAESPKNFTLKIQKQKKLLVFLNTFVFFKWLLWARTKQFRKTCHMFLARIGRKIHSSSKKN